MTNKAANTFHMHTYTAFGLIFERTMPADIMPRICPISDPLIAMPEFDALKRNQTCNSRTVEESHKSIILITMYLIEFCHKSCKTREEKHICPCTYQIAHEYPISQHSFNGFPGTFIRLGSFKNHRTPSATVSGHFYSLRNLAGCICSIC